MTPSLRICFCVSCYWPNESGAERQAHRQAAELVRRGHTVTVLTQRIDGEADVEQRDGVTIQRCIRTINHLGPAFGLSFIGSLSRAIRRLRGEVDVIHCHQGLWEAVASGWAIRRLPGVASVVQPAAGGEFGEAVALSRTKGKAVLRRLILRNQHFVAISEQIESEWLELGVDPARLTRIGSGVDTQQFRPGPSSVTQQLPAGPKVLFVGRLHAQKNLHVLLNAWRMIVGRIADAHLLLAGDGPQRGELEQLARDLGIADAVSFLGSIANPEEYLRAADVFVLASHAEGMSNSLLEAMASGLPIVTSQAGGNTDLIRHEATGLLADAAQPDEIAAAIGRLLTDRELASRCGEAARETVVQDYSIESIVDRYLALYDKLLREIRSAAR